MQTVPAQAMKATAPRRLHHPRIYYALRTYVPRGQGENILKSAEEPAVNQPRRGAPCNGRLEIAPTKLGFASGRYGGVDRRILISHYNTYKANYCINKRHRTTFGS